MVVVLRYHTDRGVQKGEVNLSILLHWSPIKPRCNWNVTPIELAGMLEVFVDRKDPKERMSLLAENVLFLLQSIFASLQRSQTFFIATTTASALIRSTRFCLNARSCPNKRQQRDSDSRNHRAESKQGRRSGISRRFVRETHSSPFQTSTKNTASAGDDATTLGGCSSESRGFRFRHASQGHGIPFQQDFQRSIWKCSVQDVG